MKISFALIVFVCLAAGLAAGQTVAPMQPSYLALGAGFNSTDSPQTIGGAAYLHPMTDDGKTLAYTLATFTAGKPTTVEPGAAQRVFRQGPLAVYALGTAGVAMGAENVGSVISGGGFAMFDLSKWVKNLGVLAGAREMKSTIVEAQPSLFFAVTYRLGEN